MTALLDLHDSSLRLWHEDTFLESPGYAWHDGNHFRFGLPAMHTQRRTPRDVNTRYWSQLSTQPLSPPLGQARHGADLVHAHLQELHQLANQPKSVLMTAPGSMDREALSLLLGIAEHLPFDIVGLVHRSALIGAASGLNDGLHVELQLHQTLITPFRVEGDSVTVAASQVIPSEGMLALQDRLANAIAASFVAQTRFDPLRSADAEQALYDALPLALTTLQQQTETQIAISGYSARITRDDLRSVGAAYGQMLEPLLPGDTPVLLENPLDLLPGLTLSAPHQNTTGEVIAKVVADCKTQLLQDAQQLTLNRTVPVFSAPTITTEPEMPHMAAVSSATAIPTHILLNSRALRINETTTLDNGAVLQQTGAGVSLSSAASNTLTVNAEAAVVGQLLQVGDRLTDATGLDALFIVVED
ncbi:MAG: hypothetical protein P8Q84_08770 [Luminiphilus sp.]|nr:hypothetical protein [Luminiphilus sp.]